MKPLIVLKLFAFDKAVANKNVACDTFRSFTVVFRSNQAKSDAIVRSREFSGVSDQPRNVRSDFSLNSVKNVRLRNTLGLNNPEKDLAVRYRLLV